MEKRVVITGLGAITPIGNNVEETWNGIENKKCGIDKITLIDASTYKTKLAAEVKNFNPLEHFEPKQAKRLDRSSQFAMVAAREAFLDSKITKENTDLEKVGVFVSSGIGGLTTIQNQCEINIQKGHNRVSPMFIPMSIANMPSGNIAIDLNLKGESVSIVTACASSTHSIGEAYRTIKYGAEDVILAGGTESSICEVGIAGFENMKALSKSEDKNRASIPFDKQRDGFVMGEGAGVVILEEYESAKARGAKIYAEMVGYGETGDAHHMTAPASGERAGAVRAIKMALEEGGIDPTEVDYINAHGTSTPTNDKVETAAIKNVFGEHAYKLAVSSTKGATGHCLGGAGGIEAVFLALAIKEGVMPPTINYENPDPDCDLFYVPNVPVKKDIKVGLSNSLGFGGHNAVIAMRKVD